MPRPRDPLQLAANYHHALPRRIRAYLNARGISDLVADFYLLGWNGWRITIPIFNREGQVVFFKLAKDPEDRSDSPKMAATPGSYAELYGWSQILSRPEEIVVCEGELDRLTLESQGLRAVTSTAGAGVFRREWAKDFEAIPKIYVCFDRDAAGREGGSRVARMIPHARIVELPAEVGDGGDVTDFFAGLGKRPEDFRRLLDQARPAPPAAPEQRWPDLPVKRAPAEAATPLRARAERAKARAPIERLVGRYVRLRRSYQTFTGLCPFHEDHNPSLAVYPATGTYHCYGCRAHGDAIQFLMEVERLSFTQALDVLERFQADNNNDYDDNE